jgi:GGDEF domain-containing protein
MVAQQVAERIRLRVERNFANDTPPVTVSVGVGMLDGAATADELVDLADRAMIEAKKAGKNLVWSDTRRIHRPR